LTALLVIKTNADESKPNCKDILMSLSHGLDSASDDTFYETVDQTINQIRERAVFWWRDLAALESIAASAIVKREEPFDAPDLPLNIVRAETQKARVENIHTYLEKLSKGDLQEKLLALQSLFLSATADQTADLALDGVESALKQFHPEIQRFAARGLWSLWVLYSAHLKAGTEGEWKNRMDRVEGLFSLGIKARVDVLEFDLRNSRQLASDLSRKIILDAIATRKKLLSQREAEAFYAAVIEGFQLHHSKARIESSFYETEYVTLKVNDELRHFIDFKVAESAVNLPMFSPEMIQALHSVDESVNENARVLATFLMEFVRTQTLPNGMLSPQYKIILDTYRIKLKKIEMDEQERIKAEAAAEAARLNELRDKKREELVPLVIAATTDEAMAGLIQQKRQKWVWVRVREIHKDIVLMFFQDVLFSKWMAQKKKLLEKP
jgi:hypothetical protein